MLKTTLALLCIPLLLHTPSVWAQQELFPNQKELEEIARMSAIAAYVDDEAQLVQALDNKIPELCEPENDKEKLPRKTVQKEKGQFSLLLKIMAPSEDLKVKDLMARPEDYLDTLRPVITAGGEAERNAAIRQLCDGKDNLEKIRMGSVLFNLLGDVYNQGMVGRGVDPFSAQDPTKDPNQTQLISIQRQYNALNVSLFNPDLPYPDVAGVCRHASTLVSDFLAQCGFDSQVIDQVQYRTHDAGHSTVRVTDPKTNKTYFLNWGELKELEGGGLVNFDIPSDSLQGYGMFIALMEPNEKGKFRGNTRTNEGVVMARLLNVADDEIDFTVYRTTEMGVLYDLGTKRIKYNHTGSTKVVEQALAMKIMDAKNVDFYGGEHSIIGAGASYNRDAVKYFGDHYYWKNRLQSSVGLGDIDRPDSSSRVMGFTHIQGMSIGKIFQGQNSSTSVELGADAVGEVYTIKTDIKDKQSKNFDGQGYVVGSVKLNHTSGKNNFAASASLQATVSDTAPHNYANEYYITANNPRFSAMYSYKLQPEKEVGVNMTYIGSVDRTIMRGELVYKDEKNKLQAVPGVMVVKSFDGKDYVYSVLKAEKSFDLKNATLQTGVSAQKSVNVSAPLMIQGTVRLTLK